MIRPRLASYIRSSRPRRLREAGFEASEGASDALCRAHFAGIARVKTTLDRELKELGCLTKRLAALVQPGQHPERVKCERESGYKNDLVDELKDYLAKLMADQNDWAAERANLDATNAEAPSPSLISDTSQKDQAIIQCDDGSWRPIQRFQGTAAGRA